MALLPADIYQPPIPSLLLLVPPSSRLQWVIRIAFLQLTLFSIPLILVLVPLSIFPPERLAPLPIHPHNLPPHISIWQACVRGWQVYIFGGLIWAITGSGSAPDHDIDVCRRLTRWSSLLDRFIGNATGSAPRDGSTLRVDEVIISPFPEALCVGALAAKGLDRRPVIGFQLGKVGANSSSVQKPVKARKAILWLTGGGYVTGYPLVDPILFSLIRSLPTGEYCMLGPNVRKSLSLDRSFPVPLLDALAAYNHLRNEGYDAKNIVIMGNSAGSGLSWSLLSYLAALDEAGLGDLGVPGSIIMISPWLSLPPIAPTGYPDLIDEPQLLNAARCYLARYPVLPHRPNPFQSDWYLWQEAIRIRITSALSSLRSIAAGRARSSMTSIEKVEQRVLGPRRSLKTLPASHLDWLEEATFTELSSHHPLISPATDLSSPFVQRTLELLAGRVRLLLHCGTAEWFYDPAVNFARTAREADVRVRLEEKKGGFHVEGCVMPPELHAPSAELRLHLLDFLLSEPDRSVDSVDAM